MHIKKFVTRKEIAQKAGVSVSVVSRALNNSGYVEKEKREKILKVAESLGYHRNPVATALRQSRTHQILFFCGDLTGSYFLQMYHGIARQAEKKGYHVLAIMNENDFELTKTSMVDGVIFPTELVARKYAETVGKNYHLPVVTACFDASFLLPKPMPMVIIDNKKVVNMAIDHLIKQGHRHIGMALPYNSGYANLRYRHWKERMMEEIGSDCMKYLIDIHGDIKNGDKPGPDHSQDFLYEIEGFEFTDLFFAGKKAAELYIQSVYKSTAILCFNDDLAFGLMEGLKKDGIRVPQDVSIIGIDGAFPRGRYEPELTTVAIYPERQGAKCVDVLIQVLEGDAYSYMNYSEFNILEGKSVKEY